jgi:D-aminopeptidase
MLDPIYQAAVQGVEEAVVNSMLAAKDSGGTPHDRFRIDAIRHDELVAVMQRYGRFGETQTSA